MGKKWSVSRAFQLRAPCHAFTKQYVFKACLIIDCLKLSYKGQHTFSPDQLTRSLICD